MKYFAKLQAVLPAVKAAEETFDAYLNAKGEGMTNETVRAEAEKLNVVLRQAVEALIQDTDQVNSRHTLESIYLCPTVWGFTIGGLTHARLVEACETGKSP